MPQSTSDPAALPASFRDPQGYVFRRQGQVFRKIAPAMAGSFKQFSQSLLYEELTRDGLLVEHTIVAEDPSGLEILPRQIPYVSYPYEWSFSQLKEAALLTLDIQKRALAHDMTLKDASSYNVQFIGAQPIFIDSLSFTSLDPSQPWVAYRQFCEHFLGPLALMAYVEPGLNKLILAHLEGIPLETIARVLPTRSKFKYSILVHLHLHARSQRKHADDAVGKGAPTARAKMSKNLLAALIDSLTAAVKGCRLPSEQTQWGDYYSATNYSEEAMSAKEQLVQNWVAQYTHAEEHVHDMGANTGRFSAIAAAQGHYVIAHDIDRLAVEKHYRALHDHGDSSDVAQAFRTRILPLQLDLSNPTPAIGWANQERDGFLDRTKTGFVLALALVHHLAIGNNVPLPMICQFFAQFARMLIIEFVPKEDSQVTRMLATREDIFYDYTIEGFETALAEYFKVVEKLPVTGTVRTLYLLERSTDEVSTP